LKAKLAVAALAGMVFIAGCGGGDDAPSPTKAEYTKSAKALCEKAVEKRQTEVEALLSKENNFDKPVKERAVNDIILPSLHRQLEELESMGLPKGEEKAAEDLLHTFAAEIKKIEAQPVKAIETGALEGTRAKAAALGLGSCA